MPEATELAVRILGATVLPYLVSALFGLEALQSQIPAEATIASDVELPLMQRVVDEILQAPAHPPSRCAPAGHRTNASRAVR